MVGLDNWNNVAEFEERHYVDTEHAVDDGEASLRIGSTDRNEVTVYEPSLNASNASSEGRIETSIRRTGGGRLSYENTYIGIVLRYYDIDNYYCAVGNGDDGLVMYRRKDGNTESVNSVDFTNQSRFSDGTRVREEDAWLPFRITWFVDKMDAFRIRIQEDADGNGSWEEVGGALVDADPILGPGDTKTGSGIGFGGVKGGRGYDGVWYDNTKIYYETNN